MQPGYFQDEYDSYEEEDEGQMQMEVAHEFNGKGKYQLINGKRYQLVVNEEAAGILEELYGELVRTKRSYEKYVQVQEDVYMLNFSIQQKEGREFKSMTFINT